MSRTTPIVVVLMLAFPLSTAASEQRAFEIADYYRTAFVGAPVLSPDGDRIAFSVTRYELEKGETWSEIWMMAADGGNLRQLTRGRHDDRSPVFSPDGATLAFLSSRDGGEPQVYLLPLEGGEARRLTSFPGGVSSPVFSPDGAHLAVTAEVYPECGADADCNASIRRTTAAGPLHAYVTDELLYRHWNSWREGRYPHVLLVDSATGDPVRDLTPGRWDSPTFALREGAGYAFSPDGREICVVSNHDSDPATSTNSDLWLIAVGGNELADKAINITADNRGWDGKPAYSPDGRFIAFLSQGTPGYESDLYRLSVYDRDERRVRTLTDRATFDNWIDSLEWAPGGGAVLFQADVGGVTPVYRFDLADNRATRLFDDGVIAGWRLTPDGGAIIYNRSRVGSPPEIFRVPSGGGVTRRLTHFNSDLEQEVDIRPAEIMWVDGEDGAQIQVFVVKPHDFDPTGRYPLILNVHGGPQSPWTDRYRGDWQVYPGKGYVVAFPNPTGSAGSGQERVDAIACDYGGRVMRDILKVADAVGGLPFVDEKRMGAMGWSWGGYAMMWFAGHTDRFQALAAMMGIYDLRSMYGGTEELWFPAHDFCARPWEEEVYGKWSPSNFTEGFSTPTVVITGERDYRVPYTQSLQFFTDLQLRKVPSRLVVFPNAGHWPSWYEMAFYYLVHLDWFHQWLGGGAPPWDVERFLRNQVFVDPVADDGSLAHRTD